MNDTQMNDRLRELDARASELCATRFAEIEAIENANRARVLDAFIKNRVSAACFAGSTGYGFGDTGRDVLDRLFADIVGAEDALCRAQFLSGTHALTVALFGLLRPGDILVSALGAPYDTLRAVVGANGVGSLSDFSVGYREVPTKNGGCDFDALAQAVRGAKVVLVQRSRGYSERASLTLADIEKIAMMVKKHSQAVVLVDNCYGEFCECAEPLSVGADLIVGSLIKNPGGAIAPCGGYIAGGRQYVEACEHRLTAPGTGRELGCCVGGHREAYLGLFFAPSVVEQALKTAVYASCLFELAGMKCSPRYGDPRGDIITRIELGDGEKLVSFCKQIQKNSPVDAFASPEPWAMPGYDCDIIMAAGAFTNGSSIELSCDAPLREPFTAYLQGGVHLSYSKRALLAAARAVID